jgi:hypothetical protein
MAKSVALGDVLTNWKAAEPAIVTSAIEGAKVAGEVVIVLAPSSIARGIASAIITAVTAAPPGSYLCSRL